MLDRGRAAVEAATANASAVVELSGALEPLAAAARASQPSTVVVHGTADPFVPFARGEALAARLEARSFVAPARFRAGCSFCGRLLARLSTWSYR